MPLSENDDMVQAPHRADEPHGKGVLPGAVRGRDDFADPHALETTRSRSWPARPRRDDQFCPAEAASPFACDGGLLVQGEVLKSELAVTGEEEGEESKHAEQERDHRAGILSGLAPTDQPLGCRPESWRGTGLDRPPTQQGLGQACVFASPGERTRQ